MGVDPSRRAGSQLNPGSRAAGADRSAAMNGSRTTITEVEPLADRWVRLTFGDGAVHEVDLADLLQAGGVFASIRDDREIFDAVASTRSSARSRGPATSILIPTCCAETKRPHRDWPYPDASFSPPDKRRLPCGALSLRARTSALDAPASPRGLCRPRPPGDQAANAVAARWRDAAGAWPRTL